MDYDTDRVSYLSERLVNGITSQLDHVIRNGDPDMTYPGCVNLSFAHVEGESLLMALKVGRKYSLLQNAILVICVIIWLPRCNFKLPRFMFCYQ